MQSKSLSKLSMDLKPNIFFIVRKQFGYSNVHFHWSKYLSEEYKITFVCPDMGWDRIISDKGITVNYFTFYNKNKVLRNLQYIFFCVKFLKIQQNGVCIISNDYRIPWISFLAPQLNYILDIRVGFRKGSKLRNWLYRKRIKLNCALYETVIILSENLAKELKIDHYSSVNVIPLGSESYSSKSHDFSNMNILYIGIFDNRNLEDTIYGFQKFFHEYGDKVSMKYTIAGFGSSQETNKLKGIIVETGLQEYIEMPGIIKVYEKYDLFDKYNIGVSYVPIIRKYKNQPVTKTFEYILSGMPVIGTATSENKLIISALNGVLIEDNPEEFFLGLSKIYHLRNVWNSNEIRLSLKEYKWSTIVSRKLKPLIEKIRD